MTDEIKEILSKMERLIVYGQYNAYYDLEKQLLDYITNLQEENQKKGAYIKYLEEYNPKYYKGEKFYGDGREDYKLRNEKAIEYILKLDKDYDINVYQEDKHYAYVLYILQEGDKDE